MTILDNIIDEDKQDYKCYNVLKDLIKNNSKFNTIIQEGVNKGMISKFPDELWEKIRKQNIRMINSFEDVFKDGANIGYCTPTSRQLSFSLNTCFICGGILPILIGTPNCIDGSHTWISYNGNIIDTTLMLIINEKYAKNLGYLEENRYNPNQDPIYGAAKAWTNASDISNSQNSNRSK